MVTDQDKIWLSQHYSELTSNNTGVSGAIEFAATYNEQTHRFQIIEDDIFDEVGGVKLNGSFKINIQERVDKRFSDLPALYVENIDTIMDRHFSQIDKSACLCSPLEENEFLFPTFQFQPFLEQLVIPFLYGQLYFTNKKHWPWQDLAHGGSGLLESYFRLSEPNKAEECVQRLSHVADWEQIKRALMQKSEVKGHTPCFCPKKDHIRRCHPDAWKGIQKLKGDIKALGIKVY